MKSRFSKNTLFIAIAISFLLTTNLHANTCSKADIEYYLDKGFSYDNVVRLCTAPASNKPTQINAQPSVPSKTITTNTATSIRGFSGTTTGVTQTTQQPQTNAEDLLFIASNLKARNVKLTPQALKFDAEECNKLDSDTILDINNRACVRSSITVNFSGLKILKISRGFFLVKEPQFIVGGNIKRDYLDINSKKRNVAEDIRRTLPTATNRYNLPVRRDSQLDQLSTVLKKYISP